MAYNGIHNHVEELVGQGVYFGHSMIPFQKESKLSAGPGHHGKPVPVCPKELERPGSDPLCLENNEAYVLNQGVIHLLEVQEYLKEDVLPHFHKLLYQIGLKEGNSCHTACPKPVQHVMEIDG